jgi:hypothetical protein
MRTLARREAEWRWRRAAQRRAERWRRVCGWFGQAEEAAAGGAAGGAARARKVAQSRRNKTRARSC